jgi:large subunit ribosomal protein L3
MDRFIVGVKKTQSQTFDEKGARVASTFIHTAPFVFIRVKTKEKDGYNALVCGFGTAKKIAKTTQGLLKKYAPDAKPEKLVEYRFRKEEIVVTEKGVKIGETEILPGQEIKPSMLFSVADMVEVTGVSKGKGFQGVVKRHHFKGGSKTHGQSDRQRAPGAIGMTTTPGRVFKGKRMAGRMGNDTVTVKGLKLLSMTDTGITVGGLIPGAIDGFVQIRKSS